VRVPGFASRGSCKVARSKAAGVVCSRKQGSRKAGRPEVCASNMPQRDVLLAAARLHADDEARQDVPEALLDARSSRPRSDEEHGGGLSVAITLVRLARSKNRLRLDAGALPS